MSKRKGRPGRNGLRDPQATDRFNFSNGKCRIRGGCSCERPETLAQAKRWDMQKSRAVSVGLCDKCAAQYASGLQIGFDHSHPPCTACASIVDAAIGQVRPNEWRNMRLRDVGTGDTRRGPRAHGSRTMTPEKYVHGYGSCGGCGSSWTGYETAHCSGCHASFVNPRAFSRHRIRGRCHDPESRGLVKISRMYAVVWGWPAQRDRLERKRR